MNRGKQAFLKLWEKTGSLYMASDLAIDWEGEYSGPFTTYGGDCCGTVEPSPKEDGREAEFEQMRGLGVGSIPRFGKLNGQ